MFEINDSKQSVIDAACIRFADIENVESIANDCGMRGQMLRNKLNPNQPHQLTVTELIKITKATDNHDIINSAILDIGLVAVRLPKQGESKPLTLSAMSVAIQTGDISRHILEAESDRRLTRHKKDAIVRKAQQAVRELVFLMSDVENRCGGAGPFVSMCADAVMNGLPIPGM
ncbi:Possible phage regulatory protein (CII) [Moritella viscosa]|uniref:phage regulatory CII family protein n=1 Tax=Moritella viscosa TaxID=80854 RepID=UPI000508F408|nr:phage regulatory CII family protein [Moritella viscosa]CED59954.1 phage regulatory protein CII [Moritella viscosa]SHO04011.1 Possible phage regulatory protein (CII) [Moritella viscosa]SHO21068.1 Possible phage regulatory protein (CII) [Moritella viscosa]